jgi:hypothetical protein
MRLSSKLLPHGGRAALPLLLALHAAAHICKQPTTKNTPHPNDDPEVAAVIENNRRGFKEVNASWALPNGRIFSILNRKQANQRTFTLTQLKRRVLDRGVPGAVVELGCNVGATSVRIRQVLDKFDRPPRREFHVYDSFSGFPMWTAEDGEAGTSGRFAPGKYVVSVANLMRSFRIANMTPPDGVHKGFFGNISDAQYPAPIAFALFDGDLYPSIMDSFKKVWHKLSVGGVIMVHDFGPGASITPGPERAVNAFLQTTPGQRVEECFGILACIVKR